MPQKSPITNVNYPKEVSVIRAFVYSLMCESNSPEISAQAFLAGCNRFGLDNPCPTVTKRLACYGNQEDLEKEFKKIVAQEKYKSLAHEAELIASGELGGTSSFDQGGGRKYLDFHETRRPGPLQKLSGI